MHQHNVVNYIPIIIALQKIILIKIIILLSRGHNIIIIESRLIYVIYCFILRFVSLIKSIHTTQLLLSAE